MHPHALGEHKLKEILFLRMITSLMCMYLSPMIICVYKIATAYDYSCNWPIMGQLANLVWNCIFKFRRQSIIFFKII